MRFGNIIVTTVAVLVASPAQAASTQTISYTEAHDPGSAVVLTQGLWDCGRMADRQAKGLMARMARQPDRQLTIGEAAGCTRTLDVERAEKPWKVVRRIAALCEERSREDGEILLPDGRRQVRNYVVCGREAHALLIERDGVRRTAIDVIDLSSYD